MRQLAPSEYPPAEIVVAAVMIGQWADKNNHKTWTIGPCQSRSNDESKDAEMAALRQDALRYREFRKGKALTIKCGNMTIFTGSNPDCERKYPEALDEALDKAMAQAEQPS